MLRAQEQRLPELQDIASRDGVRGAVRAIYYFLKDFLRRDNIFKNALVAEVNPLYGEADYTPGGPLADGAQTTVPITVPGAIVGYCVDVSYDANLQGLQVSGYVSADDTVTVVLGNGSGGPITLASGRFRAYVWPRELSS